LRFEANPRWTVAVVGALQAQVKEEYAGQPREESLLSTELKLTRGGDKPNVSVSEGFGRVRIPALDESSMLTISRDLLAVNTFKPYETWHCFKPRVERALAAYTAVLPESKVSQVGVRYINRIEIDLRVGRPEDYLSHFAANIDPLGVELRGLLHRSEYAYRDGARLLVTHASAGHEDEDRALILDIDVVRALPVPVGTDEALVIIEDLHAKEGQAFEALITDASRELFK
jgi:uncharacterized protein (TIGR04255 family)